MLKKIKNLFTKAIRALVSAYIFIKSLTPWFLYVAQNSFFILAIHYIFIFNFLPAMLCLGISLLFSLRIENMLILAKIQEHETILQGVDECFDYQSTTSDSPESK